MKRRCEEEIYDKGKDTLVNDEDGEQGRSESSEIETIWFLKHEQEEKETVSFLSSSVD